MTSIKICGLSTPDTLDAAIGAGASHVGFVFFARSPRNLLPERAAGLAARVPPSVTKVGVFVDPDDALLDAATPSLDAIQLHGSESPARLAAIRARYGLALWKAAGVTTAADIRAAVAAARGACDLLLLDAKAPSSAPLPGGNGLRFDWRLLSDARPDMAWGLSGGLDADNVGAAVRDLRPPLVDVSSGVEEAPGVKSVHKIRAFIEAVRTA
ncbi:phosphoribosylanthranilate isomerase [Glacieibacterium sp.]|uniref:phosphoribosylanthranilate isomerase n=1 Tax=Glacieibacterium sp. TaxID=2860237 RepID=UPI003AFF871D